MQNTEIIGNLTAAPELRATPNGINVCTFTVAVNKRGKDKGAEFFRVSAWRELGENCSKYLDKGRKVYVRGEVSARAFMGKDGQPKASLELTANEVEFLSPRSEQTDGSANYSAAYMQPGKTEQKAGDGWTELEDASGDLPF